MQIANGLRTGRTYRLDDYTFVQVVLIEEGWVRYRTRRRAWPWSRGCRAIEKTTAYDVLAQRAQAEVDAAFFPDFTVPGHCRFHHSAEEIAMLHRYLADRSPHRPFAMAR